MAEKTPIPISHAELVQNIRYETLIPETTVPSFLKLWYSALQQNRLNWFAATDKKSSPISSLNFQYNDNPNGPYDLEIFVPSLPDELIPRLIPLSIGVDHCPFAGPLHGDVVVNTFDESFFQADFVRSVFQSLGIQPPQGEPNKYNLSQTLVDSSDLPASGLVLLTPYVQDHVLKALGFSERQKNIVYLDEKISKTVDAMILAMIKSNVVFLNETAGASGSVDHTLSSYEDNEGNPYTQGATYIKQNVIKLLTGKKKKKLPRADFKEALLEFYEKENAWSFFAQIPPFKAIARLLSKQLRYTTEAVMTFQEFQRRLADLIPQLSTVMIPVSATDFTDNSEQPHNIIATLPDGSRIGFFLSSSSGLCKEHKQH